ncbi:hypothetical protein K2173_027863 [Erythroxylum novogranatense]|uniref:Pentatricopeptide repeat-containing protein n=1 Tax=Erythroxylum novogranatense TaxID=1862640 RepID=A0AAV8U098_9ROSI|nr:hypothetical protein K2173_027863 [Erythroxylum novogranatense]
MDCKFLIVCSEAIVVPLERKDGGRRGIVSLKGHSSTRIHYKQLPKNLRNAQRSKLPPDFGVNLFLKKPTTEEDPESNENCDGVLEEEQGGGTGCDGEGEETSDLEWESDEIEAISCLFQGRIPQKPGKLSRERPLPLPLPHKIRPLGLPTPKKQVKMASPGIVSSRSSISKQVYKNPTFLVNLAKKIKLLHPDQDVSAVLDDCARFLRKGSLSLTVRELGHMGLPERALQTFCWVQKQPHLFPDDRILCSTVEVLARNHELKVPFDLQKLTAVTSRGVIEAMVRGFIRGGDLKLAWKLLFAAKYCKRILDAGVYAKLVLELGKNPDKHFLAEVLLNDLAEREDLNLTQQDCTAVMKVCVKLGKYDIVESLFKQSGSEPSVVMYTTVIHSRFSAKEYREALAVVWEMETSNCLFDLPAYRVVMKLFVALNDLPRAVRYFSKLKDAGFSPTYDIYKNLATLYMVSGRLAKCRQILKEAEMAGLELDKAIRSQLLLFETETR